MKTGLELVTYKVWPIILAISLSAFAIRVGFFEMAAKSIPVSADRKFSEIQKAIHIQRPITEDIYRRVQSMEKEFCSKADDDE